MARERDRVLVGAVSDDAVLARRAPVDEQLHPAERELVPGGPRQGAHAQESDSRTTLSYSSTHWSVMRSIVNSASTLALPAAPSRSRRSGSSQRMSKLMGIPAAASSAIARSAYS